MVNPPFDFFTEYCAIHRAVYGRDPCTRSQWERWCKQPIDLSKPLSDAQFDIDTERREGWGYDDVI